ncbi:type II toxin-antitoxin system RelE family toxin [Methylophaga nitratireducenticrescens]|uniref:type II toxin-antitoxin system RelE family toxin n=1 Tax=Methylophaga nitratireducenticrescens TaxID=754476 RepID=UPI00059CCA3F|nr:type II toxin-antitoxin system RelE/ParE family toxin [Methylophaga nitratireducenticrescens]ASF49087.1 type II toxin-antitoxin system mRNA interferase toxin, RelE/StbE family [Methylophaga nitratireducenticrescens]AUZ83887.1 type II toxin-antitoxin system mRNA interferase toxin, RelE/StbE family [Methylophaga nitratireducenticrescens]
MANYKLVFKKSVSKDLRLIPNKDVARILQCMEQLQENPRPVGSEKLSGQERYRIRQGLYRIIYEVADELLVVTVVKVGHRKHVYKRNQ